MRRTRQYMAISPTMNDQWSGKILSRALRPKWEAPRRSSTHRNSLRVTGHGSRSRGRQEALSVDLQGQLGQGAGGGTEVGSGAVEHVEGRLVARAQQLVLVGL